MNRPSNASAPMRGAKTRLRPVPGLPSKAGVTRRAAATVPSSLWSS
jgi:hypothetical protein